MPPSIPNRPVNLPGTYNFAELPDPANFEGMIARCNPLVAGQGYFYMVSDGTFWRPYGGEQKIYVSTASINMAVSPDPQKVISIPIPPLLIPCGRTYIKTFLGLDKLGGTSDSCDFRQRLGTTGLAGDGTLFANTLGTTNISAGVTNEASRVSATEFRKHGAGNNYTAASLSLVSAVARQAAITVGDLDTTTNYLTVWGDMTTGTTEYGSIHAFTVEIMG